MAYVSRYSKIKGTSGNDVLKGGSGNDWLHGGAGRDVLYGGRGNDLLHGGKGQDKLYGGAGNDVLKGGMHDDVLYGGRGNDVLFGGQGNDVLVGGQGADVFRFEWSDTFKGKNIRDEIRDFEKGVDKIDLSALEIWEKKGVTFHDLSSDQGAAVRVKIVGTDFSLDVIDRNGAAGSDLNLDYSDFIF